MRLFQKITSNIVFAILVMIVFLLIFEKRITLPAWLQAVGRIHPLLLHLPIGFILMAGILWISRKYFFSDTFPTLFNFILHLAAFTTSLTALMGFFLSQEAGYTSTVIGQHKWAGVTLSFLSYFLVILYNLPAPKKIAFSITLLASMCTLIVAGHYGATITHGEGFVWQPLHDNDPGEDLVITDSTSLYMAAIMPILKSKCFSCHNEDKAKGRLIMTTEEQLLKGGKKGPIWVPGDPLHSHIIQNIQLPPDDKKHMPPKAKPQLTNEEVRLIYAWIQSGADMNKPWTKYPEEDSVRIYASPFIDAGRNDDEIKPSYPFEAVSASVIKKLNDPFRVVSPVAEGASAVQASFFVRKNFDRKKLEELSLIKEQLVHLNLSNMPVTDNDLKIISKFVNLEKLNLNNTDITGKNLSLLQHLQKLNSLSLCGTKVDKNITSALQLFPAMKEVYVWNTGLNQTDITALKKTTAHITFYEGYQPDENEILKLTPPILVNENSILENKEAIWLKHNLSGTIIRYTTDGSLPDSNTAAVYSAPIPINSFTVVKARAVRENWYSSDVSEFYLFCKGFQPARAELINETNDKYKGKGAATLIDGKKGAADNFKDTAWLGYREKPFAVWFYFDKPTNVKAISISYGKNVSAYILPPAKVEVWGGNDKTHLKLIKKISSPAIKKEDMGMVRVEGLTIDIPGSAFKYYKLVAKNITRLPSWHPGKGEKGWVFIDEVFFN